MSIPRSLGLRKIAATNSEAKDAYVLVQQPVKEVQALVERSTALDTAGAAWPPKAVTRPGQIKESALLLDVTLRPGRARSCGLRIRTGPAEFTEVGYDSRDLSVYVDRRQSGMVDFHPAFAGRHNAPVRLIDGAVKVRVLVDRSTIEVFANDGEAVITDSIFPKGGQPVVEIFAGDASASVEATLHELQSVWRRAGTP
jgi:sucrose-6-phosphate hydrolase SacC (GH32 family)